jgi:hypothetical protein
LDNKARPINSLIIVIIAIIVKEGVTTFQDFDSLVTNQGQKLNECHSLARTGSKWPKGVPRSKSLSIGMDGVTNFQVIDSLVTFHGQKINEFNILAWKGLEWPKGVCRHKGVCRSKGPSIIGNRIAVATLSTTESVSSLIIALNIAEPKPTLDSHLYQMVINLDDSVATDFDHDQKIIVSRSPRGGPYKMEIAKISSYFSLPKISLIILSVEFKDNIIVNIQYKITVCIRFMTTSIGFLNLFAQGFNLFITSIVKIGGHITKTWVTKSSIGFSILSVHGPTIGYDVYNSIEITSKPELVAKYISKRKCCLFDCLKQGQHFAACQAPLPNNNHG